jgi:hypothetical protein
MSESAADRMGLQPVPVDPDLKVGIALATLDVTPINGLRHLPVGDTSGWYLWGGESMGSEPDFFSPMHISHLAEVLPTVLPFLSLPAGYRFLLAGDYEDIWYDESLLVE